MSKKDKSQIIGEAVDNLLTMFQSGNFPTQLATTIIRRHEGDIVPSDSWSIGNQLLMQSQNTSDARGYIAIFKITNSNHNKKPIPCNQMV